MRNQIEHITGTNQPLSGRSVLPEIPYDHSSHFWLEGVPAEKVDDVWEKAIEDSLLGYEVLRLSGVEDVLHTFNKRVLGNKGHFGYSRSFCDFEHNDEVKIDTGKDHHVLTLNSATLLWESRHGRNGVRIFNRMGFSVADGSLLGFSFRCREWGLPLDPDTYDAITRKNKPYINIRAPFTKIDEPNWPVIHGNTIVGTHLLHDIAVWGQNCISSDINFLINTNEFFQILPDGIQVEPRYTKPLPLTKEREIPIAA